MIGYICKNDLIMKKQKKTINNYYFFESYSTRWNDNDAYGHLNNAKYVEFADSIINSWLIKYAGLKVPHGNIIGLAVKTECDFFSPISYPENINCGLSVIKQGNSSIKYEVGIFRDKEKETSSIVSFVHVYVDSILRKPILIPQVLKKKIEEISFK